MACSIYFGGACSWTGFRLFGGGRLVGLKLQRLNFPSQLFIFSHLALQEPPGQRRLFSHTGGGEQIGVTQLVGVFAEVAHLDPAFFDQGFQAEVDGADVDAHFLCYRALRYARVFLENFECPKQGVVVGSLAACGHLNNAEVRVVSAE